MVILLRARLGQRIVPIHNTSSATRRLMSNSRLILGGLDKLYRLLVSWFEPTLLPTYTLETSLYNIVD
jgi:hypothetical protein